MQTLAQQLEALSPRIAEICRVSGTPGISLGVLYPNGVYRHNCGLRDIQTGLPADSDTNYCIASMSKAFTSAALGMLVEEGKLNWDDRIKNLLPSIQSRDEIVQEMVNVADLLCHRTGLEQADALWEGAENECLLDQKDTIDIFNSLRSVKPIRNSFHYNNWSYALAGKIIEYLTGEDYAEVITGKILQPLGMLRTVVNGKQRNLTNVAEAYQTLDDCSPCHINRPHEDGRTMMASASGIQSNVNDLLRFYKSILDSAKIQFSHERSDSAEVLKQLPTILSSHQVMTTPNYLEKSYGFAWARAQLPTAIGDIGTNPGLVSKMPAVARGTSSLCWWHQGSLVGFTSFAALLPEVDAAIVVLTNSTALNDSADWIGQLLVETVLNSPEKNDYVELAMESAIAALAKARQIEKILDEQRIKGTSPRLLEDYVGRFQNASGNFRIDISKDDSFLKIAFQGRVSQTYRLDHYHQDTFCWYLPRQEQAKRGKWYNTDVEFYKISFGVTGSKVDDLVWKYDSEVLEGAMFRRV